MNINFTFEYIIMGIIIFILGCFVGALINGIIDRATEEGLSFKETSRCEGCNQPLSFKESFPMVSWILMRGKCRHCGRKLPLRYLLVEIFGGISAIWMTYHYRMGWLSITAFAIVSILTAISVIDWRKKLIPNELVIALLIPVIITRFLYPDPDLMSQFMGAAIGAVPMLFLALTFGAFGMGDVKLIAVGGLLLGWKGTLLALCIAILTGGIAGVIKLIKKTGEMEMAFGPYLCLGIFTAMLYGSELIEVYLNLL